MLVKVGTQYKFKQVTFIQYSTKRVNKRLVAIKVK